MTLRALYHWFFVTKTYFPVVRLFAEHEAEIACPVVTSKDRALKGLNDYHDHHPLASKDLP